jgi:hypothetical protein
MSLTRVPGPRLAVAWDTRTRGCKGTSYTISLYIYICVCVCVCVCIIAAPLVSG